MASSGLSLELVRQFLLSQGFTATAEALDKESSQRLAVDVSSPRKMSIATQVVAYNPCPHDPHGASSMPIYQTATFAQPGATDFGEYDYTRSGNPTRDALQRQIADLDSGARAFCFTTGMAAISAVVRLAQAGDEVIVNDDSYGGTYRLMSSVATRHGIKVTYINMSGDQGACDIVMRLQANNSHVCRTGATGTSHLANDEVSHD